MLWAMGFVSFHVTSGLIHLLLLAAAGLPSERLNMVSETGQVTASSRQKSRPGRQGQNAAARVKAIPMKAACILPFGGPSADVGQLSTSPAK